MVNTEETGLDRVRKNVEAINSGQLPHPLAAQTSFGKRMLGKVLGKNGE